RRYTGYPRGLRSLRPGFKSQHGRLLREFQCRQFSPPGTARQTLGETKERPVHTKSNVPAGGRHRKLLEEPAVRSWWQARSLRPVLSADHYPRRFGLLLETLDPTPAEVEALARAKPVRLRDQLIQDAARLRNAGRLDRDVAKPMMI
ncbi:MAG: hypothetical protein ACREC5_05425, partial [Thermoplasmata archaeon]